MEEQFEVIKRGAVEIILEEELKERLKHSIETGIPLRIKAGFDPTAPDLHLGHVVLLQKMKNFQDLGHEVIFLIGDFTGMIGDPTGQSTTRPALSPEEIQQNALTYQRQVFKILDPEKTQIRFNSEWMGKMNAQGMIELAAKYTLARMLEREDFQKRFRSGVPITVHEFLYPLVQGYDSVALRADVELGGTDQKFNLLVGREIMRAYGLTPQVIITTPLLEGLDGVQKMSKSLGNYVGIDEPPGEIFGKLMSISDELMLRYYELLSDITAEGLNRLKDDLKAGRRHPKEAKVQLAKEIVARFHGAEAAEEAAEEFDRVFRLKEFPQDVPEIVIKAPGKRLRLTELLADKLSLAKSRSDARRLIEAGAVTLDGSRITDPYAEMEASGEHSIKVGRRGFARFRFIF